MSAAPRARLHPAILRANAQIWAQTTKRPVWAVVKSNGYGWGLETMAEALEAWVTGFCVADANEFFALRALTDKPIRLFSQPHISELSDVLAQNGSPAITTCAALEYAAQVGEARGRPVRVSLGLSPAVGWFGINLVDLPRIYELAGSPWLECELWSHLTTADAYDAEYSAFEQFAAGFRERNIPIVSCDIENTAPLAQLPARFDSARIGIGLFGAHARTVIGLRCAVSLIVGIAGTSVPAVGRVIGYGRKPAPPDGVLTTLRIGYGDGLPRSLVGACIQATRIVNIGMQYTVIHSSEAPNPFHAALHLIDEDSDLVECTQGTGCSPHELIVGLGLAAKQSEPG